MTLPVALSGTDVIGQAKTGTGKTLGFGLPLLERVTVPADVEAGRAAPDALTDAPQALVVVPTRELCQQVTNDLLTAGKVRNVRVTAIYGGRAYEPQVEALKKGVDVVVGTPGRLLDLAGQKKLDLKHVKCLVLDEADEMLDLGFLPDVEKIVKLLPVKRQTMLFSATMPGAVIGLARRYMSQPTHIRATAPDDEGQTVANTTQFVYRAHNMDKPEMVARILQAEGRGLAMVFCRTKRTAADLADQLQQRGFASGAVHGDLGQGAREQALRAFRNGKVDVLVCTDVAARGIDVEGVTHVINYQSPEEEKTYLHRIGRTGRAGAKGTAITLVDWDDIPRWQLINKALQLDFNDPPETYSTSPHLYTDLSIPEGTKGVLPRAARTRAGLAAEELEDLGEPGGRGGRDRGRGGRGGRNDSRSGRDDSRSGRDDSRSGPDESRSADRERSARTPRRRRRTRGGSPLDAAVSGNEAATAVTGATSAAGATGVADAGTPGEDENAPRTLRRRRRTRNGAPSRQSVATAATESPVVPDAAQTIVDSVPASASASASEGTSSAAVTDAVAAPVTAVAVAEAPTGTEAPAKSRRRRTRKSAEAPTVPAQTVPSAEAVTATEVPVIVEAAPAATAPAATAPAEEAPVAKPRRRTRKAAAAAETAVDTAESTTAPAETAPQAAEAKPRRTRKTAAKATAPAETPVDAAEGTGTGTTDAAVAEVADVTEAKPKARRTRKATAKTTAKAPAETAAEAAVDTAEATEADAAAEVKPKTRRTRKTAAPKATAEAPAEAAAETAVDTAAGTEAKPKARRTRKATAETTADIPAQTAAEPEPEAKPRRTRKTAATKATATAEGTEGIEGTEAETKPKARRTRKATAKAPEAAESPES
ncbi:DEAD/DEAH box helicase [Streptomyces sp. CRN 30]|uniref:DEAD/DEAH box helicase n=1 Tax=Streptomyces sp. CRN 30 TaxID=3075613 RepID=UPI002A83BAAE|nr:DEAD/DEAH box helicase [Streptomyces sp. CRN 30]